MSATFKETSLLPLFGLEVPVPVTAVKKNWMFFQTSLGTRLDRIILKNRALRARLPLTNVTDRLEQPEKQDGTRVRICVFFNEHGDIGALQVKTFPLSKHDFCGWKSHPLFRTERSRPSGNPIRRCALEKGFSVKGRRPFSRGAGLCCWDPPTGVSCVFVSRG